MMQIYQAIVVILCFTALLAYLNERFIKLPTAIGITALSLLGSLALVLAGNVAPWLVQAARRVADTINFPALLMRVMLGFLLFAGSIQMSERELKRERIPITVLATLGTAISVFPSARSSGYCCPSSTCRCPTCTACCSAPSSPPPTPLPC